MKLHHIIARELEKPIDQQSTREHIFKAAAAAYDCLPNGCRKNRPTTLDLQFYIRTRIFIARDKKIYLRGKEDE